MVRLGSKTPQLLPHATFCLEVHPSLYIKPNLIPFLEEPKTCSGW